MSAMEKGMKPEDFKSLERWPLELRQAVSEAIQEGIERGIATHCRIPIGEKEAQQVRFLFDNIRHLGDGDIHHGLDVMDENHKWVKRMRGRFNGYAEKVGGAVLIIVAGGVLTLIGYGIRHWLTKPIP